MSLFHVYVEGAIDRTPDGIERLAEAIAQKFGIPITDLMSRLATAKFRVKANVDRATADTYAKALTELGAKVRVEAAGAPPTTGSGLSAAGEVARPTLPPSVQPPPRTKAPSLGQYSVSRTSSKSSLPPPTPGAAAAPASAAPAAPPARPSSSSQPPPVAARATIPPAIASGLAAAYSQDVPVQADLGALGADSLALASLDGHDDPSPSAASFAPPAPAGGLPASFGPAATPAPPPKAKAAALDLFAPPEAEQDEALVDLAADEVAHREEKAAAAAVQHAAAQAAAAAAPAQPAPRKNVSVLGGVSAASPPELSRPLWAAGVLVSILLGFGVAHGVATVREDAAFRAIDATVQRTQQEAVEDPALYEQLDGFRRAQLDKKRDEQRSIALTSMLLWAVVSAGAAYAWYRRVPWDRILPA